MCPVIAQTSSSTPVIPSFESKYVSDGAGLISKEIKAKIAQACFSLEKKMKIRVLVKTKKFSDISKSSAQIESFFTDWRRNISLDKRGILIYAALTDKSAEGQIHINVGIGLKYLVTKAMGRKILDQVILPKNSMNQDGKAFLDGVLAIKTMLVDEFKRTGGHIQKGTKEFSLLGFLWASKEILIAFIIAILLCYIIFFVERCPRCNAILKINYEILKEPGVNTLGVKRKIYICEKCGFSRRKKEPVYPRGKAGWWMRIAGVRRNVKIE